MNQSYARVMHPMLCSHTRTVFGVKLYKNNARALLPRILIIVSSDWLKHTHSVCGVYMNLHNIRLIFVSVHRTAQTSFKIFLQTKIMVDGAKFNSHDTSGGHF